MPTLRIRPYIAVLQQDMLPCKTGEGRNSPTPAAKATGMDQTKVRRSQDAGRHRSGEGWYWYCKEITGTYTTRRATDERTAKREAVRLGLRYDGPALHNAIEFSRAAQAKNEAA